MINIINPGCGNVISVRNWALKTEKKTKIISNPEEFEPGTIVIPGVASSYYMMLNLMEKNFIELLFLQKKSGDKIIGICAGFQVMGKSTTEDDGCNCLGFIDAYTERLHDLNNKNISQSGWMDVNIKINKESILSRHYKRKKVLSGEAYFNHRYGMKINSKKIDSEYNFDCNGYITHYFNENIYGFQFHPEKSLEFGRSLLKVLI